MATGANKTKVVRNKPDELLKIIKALEQKGSVKAVNTLVALCDDEDPKVRFSASKAILDTIKEMKDQVEKQDLQRILVQAKLNLLKPPAPDEDSTPRVCFDEIQDV